MERRLELAVRNAVTRLPPGFRFHPTDEELVVQYLRRKVLACPLPAAVIPEINLAKHDPWDLPGGAEGERYFFTLLEAKYPNGGRRNRAARSGYWKATGKDKPVVAYRYNNRLVGLKKVLVFYRGKIPHGSRTDWVMHEYRLAAVPERKNPTHGSLLHTKDWVVCRIFKKSTARTDSETTNCDGNGRDVFINLMMQRDRNIPVPASSSSSPSSSCVTELSEDGEDGGSSSSMASSPCGREG